MPMSQPDRKKVCIGILVVCFFSFILIFSSIISGLRHNDVMLRFKEHETVTFFSALLLGLTSITSLYMYLLKKRVQSLRERYSFWLISALGFFYLCIDEYFMAHEGLDEWIGFIFGRNIKQMNFDGLVILFFGLVALSLCIYFHRVILKHKVMIPFLVLGGVCLVGTVAFHLFERINIYLEVTEESIKIIGVAMFFTGYLVAFLSFLETLHPSLIDGSRDNIERVD